MGHATGVKASDDVFAKLADALGQRATSSVIANNQLWQRYLLEQDEAGRTLPRELWRRLCQQRAALWQDVSLLFDPRTAEAGGVAKLKVAFQLLHVPPIAGRPLLASRGGETAARA